MKTTITGFIQHQTGYGGEDRFSMMLTKDMTSYGFTMVMPYSFDVEIPDSFDPRTVKIKALQAEELKLRADFEARITQIKRQISELLALEQS